MSKQNLLRQAENAERHADQTVDEELKAALIKAAGDYRSEAELPGLLGGRMYALFCDKTQLGRIYPSEKEAWEAALMDGFVTDIPVADEAGGQVLPVGYHVQQVAEQYDPQPDRKLPRETS
jgi:hypothetical protein